MAVHHNRRNVLVLYEHDRAKQQLFLFNPLDQFIESRIAAQRIKPRINQAAGTNSAIFKTLAQRGKCFVFFAQRGVNDGCPYQSPDGLTLYMASNRPGGFGGQDIWVARRASEDDPWGAPENLGATINTEFDDFCPTPVRGHGLYFVSARPGGCGGPDMYFTRITNGVWEQPQNLGCHINSSAGEASPSYFEDESGSSILYFSSVRSGGFEPGGVDSDIYFSLDFGVAQLAPGLNTAVDDSRPNVRKDGREIVFDSNRSGGVGGADIWTASRESTSVDWPSPGNFGAVINSSANETRASLSWDGLQLLFGSNRTGVEGMADIFVSRREKLKGHER